MKTIFKTAFAGIFVLALGSFPIMAEERDSSSHVTNLEKRIEKLEEAAGVQKDEGSWFDRVKFSGLVEAEAGYEKVDFAEGDDEESSDLSLATVELGMYADIARHVSGHVLFLYEDGEDVLVDEGYIMLDGKEALPVYFKFGEFYVPFGNFSSNMISDPLTVDLGETRETAMEVGFEANGFYGALYGFNGDADEDGKSSRIDNFGAMAGYAMESGEFTLDAGAGYINNLLDSDGLTDVLDQAREELEEDDAMGLRNYAGGVNAHAVLGFGPFSLVGEYMAALDDPEFNITEDEAITVEKKERPRAWNLEGAYIFSVLEKETNLAVGWQGSENTEDLLPEKRILGAVSVGIFENTALALEYLHDEYESKDEADVVTAQLAVEF